MLNSTQFAALARALDNEGRDVATFVQADDGAGYYVVAYYEPTNTYELRRYFIGDWQTYTDADTLPVEITERLGSPAGLAEALQWLSDKAGR